MRASGGAILGESESLSHGHRASLARAYPPLWRLAAGALVATSRASLPLIAVVVFLHRFEPFPLPTLLALLAAYAALPGAAAWLLARVFTVAVEIRERTLHVRGRRLRLEVPCASIAHVEPWRVPLPGPGVCLRLRSGALLRPGLEAQDPGPLLGALAQAGGVASARDALRSPFVAWAVARPRRRRGPLARAIAKFPLFGLLPTGVLVNAHQHIAYGGTFGQYHLEGLGAWLATFAFYWATACVYLVLYASVWRSLGEMAALLAARAGSARAASLRRGVEIVCGVAYYAGVPALVLARFLL